MAEEIVTLAGNRPAPEPQKPESAETPTPEKKLVSKLTDLVKVPAFLEPWYKRFESDRKYVNEDCMLIDDEDCVATNYIFRNQQVQLANIFAREPDVAFTPRQIIGLTPPAPVDPMTGGPAIDPMTGQPISPPEEELPPGLTDFGRTLDILTSHFAEEGDFRSTLTGAIQDAMTVGIAWIKLSQQEDVARDPLGNRRQNDQQDNLATCQWLRKRFAAGEFDEDSAEFKQMKDCEGVVAVYLRENMERDMAANPAMQQVVDPMTGTPMLDPVTGTPMEQPDPADPRLAQLQMLEAGQAPDDLVMQPEIQRYLGFNFDPVQPEDIRFDWSITRPEDLYHAQWFAHRVFMDRDAIGAKWQIDPKELEKIKLYDGTGNACSRHWYETTEPSSREELEAAQISDRCALWEFWDKRTGKVYVWAEGMDRFLAEYLPSVVWRGWFPFFPLFFNRVTGRVIPLSDTTLVRHLQDEVNNMRTWDREARKAALPRFLMKAGVMEPKEKDDFENGWPFRIHEVQAPDEIKKSFETIMGAPYDPKLYDTTPAIMEMEQLSGVSRQASGVPGGGDTATESAIANDQFGMQSELRKGAIEQLIKNIFLAVAEMGLQFLPEENVKSICGMGAYWPMFDRERLFRFLKLDVRAGSSGKPEAEKRIKLWTEFANIAASLGLPVNGIEVLKELLRSLDLNIDVSKFIMNPMAMPMPGMGGPAPIPGGPPPTGGAPVDAEPAIPGPPGRPPGGAPGPASIPNRPQV